MIHKAIVEAVLDIVFQGQVRNDDVVFSNREVMEHPGTRNRNLDIVQEFSFGVEK